MLKVSEWHTSSDASKLGLGELIPQGYHDAAGAQDKYQDQVGNLWAQATVEAVIQPRHKGTHGQQSYTTVVQPESRE